MTQEYSAVKFAEDIRIAAAAVERIAKSVGTRVSFAFYPNGTLISDKLAVNIGEGATTGHGLDHNPMTAFADAILGWNRSERKREIERRVREQVEREMDEPELPVITVEAA